MNWFEALWLGIIQGLTEYLPVSSSGHLTIASTLFGIEAEENLAFTIAVHVATVLSTLVILWKEIAWIFKGLFQFKVNDETRYVFNILISMIPVGIVGLFFKENVEQIFGSGLAIVGSMLLVTALLLTFSYYAKPRQKENISLKDAFIIGLAQAVAVMPGLSRSGSTIATGLILGNNKDKLAQFLLPHGHSPHSGRGSARHHEDGEVRCSLRDGRHLAGRVGRRFRGRLRVGLRSLQVDD